MAHARESSLQIGLCQSIQEVPMAGREELQSSVVWYAVKMRQKDVNSALILRIWPIRSPTFSLHRLKMDVNNVTCLYVREKGVLRHFTM